MDVGIKVEKIDMSLDDIIKSEKKSYKMRPPTGDGTSPLNRFPGKKAPIDGPRRGAARRARGRGARGTMRGTTQQLGRGRGRGQSPRGGGMTRGRGGSSQRGGRLSYLALRGRGGGSGRRRGTFVTQRQLAAKALELARKMILSRRNAARQEILNMRRGIEIPVSTGPKRGAGRRLNRNYGQMRSDLIVQNQQKRKRSWGTQGTTNNNNIMQISFDSKTRNDGVQVFVPKQQRQQQQQQQVNQQQYQRQQQPRQQQQRQQQPRQQQPRQQQPRQQQQQQRGKMRGASSRPININSSVFSRDRTSLSLSERFGQAAGPSVTRGQRGGRFRGRGPRRGAGRARMQQGSTRQVFL